MKRNRRTRYCQEDLLIRHCARTSPEEERSRKIEKLLHRDLDWDYIAQETKDQGVTPLLYHSLSRMENGRDYIPDDILTRLKNLYYGSAANNILLYQRLSRVLAFLREENIKVIVLKGAALAERVYGNPALRPMSDVDLLVRKEDLPQIDEKLRLLGYTTEVNYLDCLKTSDNSYLNTIMMHSTVSPPLHLHWHLANSTIPTFIYSSKIEMERIWQEAIPTRVADVGSLVLAPYHLIIHLSEHALKPGHSLRKLISLCDIHEAVRVYRDRLNWGLLKDEAFRFNLNRQLYYCLHLASQVLGTDVPGDILDKLKPKSTGFIERRFSTLALRPKACYGFSYLIQLAMCQSLSQKIRFLWRTLFPPRQILVQRYVFPQAKRGPLYSHLLRRFAEGSRALSYLGRNLFSRN